MATRHIPRRTLGLAIASIVLSGCVAGADGPSPTDPHDVTTTTIPPTTTLTVALEAGLAGYRDCLADEGVAIPEISLDGRGRPRMAVAMGGVDFTDPDVLAALDVCAPALSSGALSSEADPEFRRMVQVALEELVGCIRDHGVAEFPLPDPEFDGVGSPFPVARVPWTDPGLPAAVDVCTGG